ncbi:GNAT family N-acetyltransferase [Amycolatopsis aidingensis]|uniref:GNAT family N-acetyltransferase n=1 Tax=Amycolatopsis aidingensis TaxID=2842453 RepID=UPI001C0BF88E|nr:GNAT family N-acetyltransferase [Amycolatopsis aidingensis]
MRSKPLLRPANTTGAGTPVLRPPLTTERLILRGWRVEDAPAALAIFGHVAVARWLSPDMDQVPDRSAMRLLLQQWIAETARMAPPAGRWAMQRRSDGRVIGGSILLPLPPGNEDLEIGWQLHPDTWGCGYATEATHALAAWAFRQDVDELFAVVRPGNTRAAATVRRNGMHWVGETDKYFGLMLQLFRLRPADLDSAAPNAQLPPAFRDN